MLTGMRRQLLPAVGAAPIDKSSTARRGSVAGLFVAAVWVGMLSYQMAFVARTVSRIPSFDEYCNLPHLVGDAPSSWGDYWRQHNEHRIPLPKLVYVNAVRLTGYDFRAPAVLSALLLSASALGVLLVLRRIRGRWAFTDAVVPLVLMHVGHWENILLGFQLQFTLSTSLILIVLMSGVAPGDRRAPWRLSLVTLAGLLLPLCGANGVAACPAVGAYLVYLGATARPRLLATGLGVGGGLAVWAMVPAYFHDLRPLGYNPTSRDPAVVLPTAVNVLGATFGLAAQAVRPAGWDVSPLGAAVAVLVAVTVGRLLVALHDPERRPAAVGAGAVLAAVGCLALGLGYGRGNGGEILNCHRYVTLAAPLAVALYVTWQTVAPDAGRWVGWGMLVVAAAAMYPNVKHGNGSAGRLWFDIKRVEGEIKAGVPIGFVVGRNPQLYPPNPDLLRPSFERLRDRGVEPFRRLVADPPMTETPVLLQPKVEGLERDGDWLVQPAGRPGGLTLALPGGHVYGLKIVYEAEFPQPHYPVCLVSWEPGGAVPPRPDRAAVRPLAHTTQPLTCLLFVDQPTDAVRIDLFEPGSRIRLHSVSVLTRAD